MSYIGTKPADQVLDSTLIADGTILTADLANGAVTSAKIADANVTPAKLSQPFTRGTAVASTSGTSIDFTSIPSWVKRVTVMFNGVSTNGGSIIQVQIGSGSVTTSGYASYYSTNGASGTITSGFYTSYRGDAANALRGNVVITNISTNNYVAMGVVGGGSSNDVTSSSGSVTLGGTLDRVRITTVNGTDTFDAGSINILYE